MKRVMLAAGCVGTMLVLGCANSPEPVEIGPLLNETTLTRYDGSAISVEELESIRFSAVSTAETIARIEHELHEPWAETRSALEILSEVSSAHPSETRLASRIWESTEPRGQGQDRALFREYGFYRNELMPASFGPGIRPESLEQLVELMLEQHSDATPRHKLLAAWRRLSPRVADRKERYLASHWRFELDYVTPVELAVSESLLGPHYRSEVIESSGASFPGPTDSFEGYSASALLLDLLAPGGDSPVRETIEALNLLAGGAPARLPVEVAEGASRNDNDVDPKFLRAVLRGLMDGTCELDALPGATRRLQVTFSYLLEDAEARSTLAFEREGRAWQLTMFDYEPAGANLLSNGARLDLMPIIRAIAGSTGR